MVAFFIAVLNTAIKPINKFPLPLCRLLTPPPGPASEGDKDNIKKSRGIEFDTQSHHMGLSGPLRHKPRRHQYKIQGQRGYKNTEK